MSRKEDAILEKELYRPLLPKLGVNRNFPLLLRYNPPFLLGLDLHNLYVEQGLIKLLIFANHTATDTMTRKIIQTSIEHHQLEIGSFTSIFQFEYNKYCFLTSPTLLTILWKFITEHDTSLRNSLPHQSQLLRQYDIAILDTFLCYHNISTSILLSINRARCYLKLFSLVDITTGNDLRMRADYAQGRPGDTVSQWN